jgi:hypothetical protein
MSPQEGVEVFRRALSLLGWPKVVVSTGDLGARRARWLRTAPGTGEQPAAAAALHPRPVLAQTYVEPRGETERAVAGIWRGVLGIAEIGAFDNLFDLGGDSLLVTQVASILRRTFQVDVPLRILFDRSTVAGQAEALACLLAGPEAGGGEHPLLTPIERAGSTLDQLGDLASLSDEEARLLLELEAPASPGEQGAEGLG